MTFDRRKLGFGFVLAALLAFWFFVGRKAPTDQVLHLVLGDAAPRVTELQVRYLPEGDPDPSRDASFHFSAGQAPRIVTHEPRLANGDYSLEIEVAEGNDRAVVRRKVKLDGNPVSVDVRESLP